MRRLIYSVILVIFLLVFFVIDVSAWDTDITHSYITSGALSKASNLDRFLGDIGLTNERFDSQDLRDFGSHGAKGWILLGSIWEDFGPDHYRISLSSPNNRFFNHYFDPVNNVGLTISFPFFVDGQVSRDWSKGIEVDTDPVTPINIYDWQDARTYLYTALTSVLETERNRNFALTFRSLGQVIHLLEDASQPSHVRNDPHVGPSDNIILSKIFNPSRLEEWGKLNGRSIDVSSTQAKSLSTFDDYFNGLASTVNTNFFSDDTIFNSYSFPSEAQTDVGGYTFNTPIATVIDEDGEVSRTIYITKTGGLLTGYKVAHSAYFSVDIAFFTGLNTSPLQYDIDDRVAQENAQVLIPKAVEYAAGLLNYFFRGDLETSGFSYTSTSVTANIRNDTRVDPTDPNSAIEVMGLGELLVSYSFIDNQGNTVYDISDIFNVTSVPSVEDTSPPLNLTFTLGTPIPPDAVDVSFTFVYRGLLGNEAGAVVAAPPSTRIVYAHQIGAGNPSNIYSIDPDGRKNIWVTDESDGYTWDFDPDLSPDGTKLAFMGESSVKDIVIVDMISQLSYPNNIITILDSGQLETSPALSPDGTKVAATLDFVLPAQVIIFNVASGTSESIIIPDTSIEWIQGISWSPDGAKFAFAGRTSTGTNPDKWDIYTVNTDGTGLTMLTSDAYDDESPAWSPDGTEIAFVSDRNDGTTKDLWIMNADGINPLRITDFPFNNHIWSLDWSPDGKQIVISAGSAFFNELYVITLDDESLYQLTDYGLTSSNSSPSWSIK